MGGRAASRATPFPDGVVFDLDELEQLAAGEAIEAFVADRNRQALVELDGRRLIAPNGGNFIVRTELLAAAETKERIRRVSRWCDGSCASGRCTPSTCGA